ncbi:outer membrane usher protein [Paraburkholderia atlantica]|uniref:fimbria/pilus outer membrane usher protein n=2 Tax=Paraburkholderia atlantica TaxID=2654982 RepID=UPI003D20988F
MSSIKKTVFMRIRQQEPPIRRTGSWPAPLRRRLAILGALATWLASVAHADTAMSAQVQFDDQFLMKPRNQSVDVSRFERGNPVVPGEYTVDLYVNGNWIGHPAVNFRVSEGVDSATPCFDKSLVARLGLNQTKLSDKARVVLAGGGECLNLGEIVEGASVSFDLSDLRLDVSIPQIALSRIPQGYVSPEFWDAGVPSASLGYNLNAFRVMGSGYGSTQTYLGLNSGVNIGSWHLRQNSAFNWQPNGPRSYQNIATYAQHDLPGLRSQLTIGDAFTDGVVFDSIGIRGVQLGSDDRMLPDSQRGYAPLIRGIALTNARVTVTQNGNRLYETTVPPGAFEIDDLYATGYGGNLLVTITEADGGQRSFTVPYASVVQLLRPGVPRFNFVLGQIRDAELDHHANIVQGTFQYGINNLVTGYAGVIAAQGYAAGLIGAAFNTPLGALALDVTQASASIRGAANTSGQSVRISYSKLMSSTDTNFTVAAYRYSSSGFWALRDAMLARKALDAGQSPNATDRQRNQVQLTMNQGFGGGWGNAYAVGSTLDYWNRAGTTTQFQIGYNNFVRALGTIFSYNLSLSRQLDTLSGQMNNQLFLNVSVPLGKSQHAPTLATSVVHDNISGWSEQAMLTGTAGVDDRFSYGVNVNHASGSTVGGVNGQYRSPYATFLGSASTGSGYSQVSGGMSGALVAHPGGVTFANDLGETVGIVEAKGADGARVTNSSGVRIDSRGYAVIPYLMPYRANTVDIDPKGLPLDVEFKSTTQQVTPRANSVVMIHFDTVTGRAAVIIAHRPNGAPLPFGASVRDAQGRDIGVIGQGSRIFARGIDDAGTLAVKWGDAVDEQCLLHYQLPARGEDRGRFAHAEAVCDVSASARQAQAAASTIATAQMQTPQRALDDPDPVSSVDSRED